MDHHIRKARKADAAAICNIYNYYVLNTAVNFEEEEVRTEVMAKRIEDVTAILPWLVSIGDSKILGYAYATKWRPRAAYRYSVESSVYVANDASGKGVGTALYKALLAELAGLSIHTVIGGIVLPNERSVTLHEKLGFEKVGHLREVGFKLGQWLDVGYWQLIIKESGAPCYLASR